VNRAAIFVDGSNLYHGMRRASGSAAVDLGKLGLKLAGDDQLVAIYYYIALVPRTYATYGPQQKFIERVKETALVRLRLGRMEEHGGQLVEKGVDVLIAVDMLEHAYENDYDVAILVSGDGDFAEAVKAVRARGKTVYNAFFTRGRSYALGQVCARFIALSPEYFEDCRPD
jgi:uncharacterized LabA/DUF88 family protein